MPVSAVGARGTWALLAAAAALPYLNALPNAFTLDDYGLIVGNVHVAAFDLARMWGGDYWSGFQDLRSGLYRPLTLTTFALERALFGPSPQACHVANLLLHVAATLLMWRLFAPLAGAAVAAWGAAVFAVLPAHSEAVIAAAGRADLLAGVACLACLALWDSGGGGRRAATGAGLFALALLSKEQAVVVPGLLACLHLFRRAHGALPRWPWGTYGLAAGVLALYLGARWAVLGGLGPVPVEPLDNPLVLLQTPARIVAALAVLARYARLLVLPARLSADYSFAAIPVADLSAAQAAAGLALAALVAAGLVRFARHRDVPGLALAWTAIAFALVANLFVTVGTIMAERLTYLPSVGFALGVGWALQALGARVGARAATTALATLVLAGGARTSARCGDWRDDLTLWRATVAAVPNSARAREGLGSALRARGALAEAEGEYRRAVAIYPRYDTSHYNLGLVLLDTARDAEALVQFERACALRPAFAEAHLNRGVALARLGRTDAARQAYARALELRPGWDAARGNLEMAR